MSPSTLDRRLEDKLMMLERTTEAAVKRTRDLEMTVKNLRLDLDVRGFVETHKSKELVAMIRISFSIIVSSNICVLQTRE